MKRKHTFWNFAEYETDALAEYLEIMAAKGWYLKKIKRGGGLHFEKGEPRSLTFCAAVIPESSEFDSAEREEIKTFCEYCEEAGWHLQCGNHVWQIFYTEEENPLPIETDPELKIETEKAISLSPGRLFATGLLLLFLIVPILMTWKDPVYALSSGERLISSLLVFLCVLMMLYYPLSSWLWYRKAERSLKQGEALPKTSFSNVKKRGTVEYLYTLLLVAMLCGMGGRSGYVIEFIGVLIAVEIGRFILNIIREKGSSREQKAIVYAISAFILAFLFLSLYHSAVDRFLPDKGRDELSVLAETDFPVPLKELGFDVSDVIMRIDRQTPFARYQEAYGYCITPEKNEVHIFAEYYSCRFKDAVKRTLDSQYPADHGNAWEVEKVSESYKDGVTLVKYTSKLDGWEAEGPGESTERTLYLAYTEYEILSFDFNAGAEDGEAALMEAMRTALSADSSRE